MEKEEIYNIGREAHLSNKYQSNDKELFTVPRPWKSAQIVAYESCFPQYKDFNGVANTKEWKDFSEGWYSVDKEKRELRRKELKIDEFIEKLEYLCRDYAVTMNFGCGCCGAGANCKDYSFEFEIKHD